jgi:hypothetical protein
MRVRERERERERVRVRTPVLVVRAQGGGLNHAECKHCGDPHLQWDDLVEIHGAHHAPAHGQDAVQTRQHHVVRQVAK